MAASDAHWANDNIVLYALRVTKIVTFFFFFEKNCDLFRLPVLLHVLWEASTLLQRV